MRFAEFHPIETERLLLRKLQLEDVYEYYERLFGDGDVTRYLLSDPHQDISESLNHLQQKLEAYEAGNFYCWGIARRDEDSLIGLVALQRLDELAESCSFALMLGCDYWNQGYGTEVLKELFRFAFEELELQRIFAEHMTPNTASGKAMEKAGMQHIGTEAEKYEKLGLRYNAEIYEIRSGSRKEMTVNAYQKLAMQSLNPALSKKDMLINGVMGLCGESGEAIDLVKKHLHQGHDLDREKLAKELGDIAWYLAETAYALDISLEDILRGNLDKLKKRYPEGFDSRRSVDR